MVYWSSDESYARAPLATAGTALPLRVHGNKRMKLYKGYAEKEIKVTVLKFWINNNFNPLLPDGTYKYQKTLKYI